jgi:hypothetical protein
VVKSSGQPHLNPGDLLNTATALTPIFFTNSKLESEETEMASFADEITTPQAPEREGEITPLVDPTLATTTPHEHTEDCQHDHSDEEDIPPINRIIYPADVIDLTDDMDIVYVNGTRAGKVTKIGGFEGMKNLQVSWTFSCSSILLTLVLITLYLI